MSIALSQQSFFFNALSSTHFPKGRSSLLKRENQLAKLAMVTLAAGVLTLGSVHEASAAKTGGRIGGQAFRSAPPRASSLESIIRG
ncbi:hypothetical protein CK203_044351 [Vitis vinifera]|uniref:Uncharacterized protein n=1 Tax=Vitis vinifera TaxID=29760 RepID=A0A438H8M9_VITVI|nr:hypothetical protein CK203_044351 [Vitis vinifera]